ncbi:heat shock protein beta-1-like [Sardina pilchardus]|uniref:heat shock protein beta-1-like n=1 Tax=Sardina pilchardus TaxID=27697 RepID=UPI002E1003C8
MGDENKMMPRPLFLREDHFHDWAMPSRLFNRELEFPPFLDKRDLNWLEWAQKRLAGTSWPGYRHGPVISPPGSHPSTRAQSQVTEGTSELVIGQGTWRVSLDINQFTPEDITVRTKDGYLEITGKHEERQDAHGLVSRCFNRKYRLPAEVDTENIACSVSPGGVLSVEAPLPASGTRRVEEIVIPIQIQQQ